MMDAMPCPADAELLAAWVGNQDRQALCDLFTRYQARAWTVALRLLGDGADADDGVQQGFLAVMRSARQCRGEQVGAWLLAVVANQCRSARRSRDRHRRRFTGDPIHLQGAAMEQPTDPVAVEVRQAVADLPEHERLAITLHFFDGLDQAEVAAVLGRRPATVRVQLHRAVDRLRSLLAARGVAVAEASLAATLLSLRQPVAVPEALTGRLAILAQQGPMPATLIPVGTGLVAALVLGAGMALAVPFASGDAVTPAAHPAVQVPGLAAVLAQPVGLRFLDDGPVEAMERLQRHLPAGMSLPYVLPPGAERPGAVRASLDATRQGPIPVRRILDDLARCWGWSWEARDGLVVFGRKVPAAERDEVLGWIQDPAPLVTRTVSSRSGQATTASTTPGAQALVPPAQRGPQAQFLLTRVVDAPEVWEPALLALLRTGEPARARALRDWLHPNEHLGLIRMREVLPDDQVEPTHRHPWSEAVAGRAAVAAAVVKRLTEPVAVAALTPESTAAWLTAVELAGDLRLVEAGPHLVQGLRDLLVAGADRNDPDPRRAATRALQRRLLRGHLDAVGRLHLSEALPVLRPAFIAGLVNAESLAQALGRLGDVATLDQAVAGADLHLGWAACRGLGVAAGATACAALSARALAAGPQRLTAAAALLRHPEASAAQRRAVLEDCATVLGTPDELVVLAEALRGRDDDALRTVLLQAVPSVTGAGEEHGFSWNGLAEILATAEDTAVVAELSPLLSASGLAPWLAARSLARMHAREAAGFLLAGIAGSEDAPGFLTLLSASAGARDPQVALAALARARGLPAELARAVVAGAGPHPPEVVRRNLDGLLADPALEIPVRLAALQALPAQLDPATEAVLRRLALAADQPAQLRGEVIAKLKPAVWGKPDAHAEFQRLARQDTAPFVRANALYALDGRMDAASVRDLLAVDSNPQVRTYAAATLSHDLRRDPPARQALLTAAAADPHPRVRATAIEALHAGTGPLDAELRRELTALRGRECHPQVQDSLDRVLRPPVSPAPGVTVSEHALGNPPARTGRPTSVVVHEVTTTSQPGRGLPDCFSSSLSTRRLHPPRFLTGPDDDPGAPFATN